MGRFRNSLCKYALHVTGDPQPQGPANTSMWIIMLIVILSGFTPTVQIKPSFICLSALWSRQNKFKLTPGIDTLIHLPPPLNLLAFCYNSNQKFNICKAITSVPAFSSRVILWGHWNFYFKINSLVNDFLFYIIH